MKRVRLIIDRKSIEYTNFEFIHSLAIQADTLIGTSEERAALNRDIDNQVYQSLINDQKKEEKKAREEEKERPEKKN